MDQIIDFISENLNLEKINNEDKEIINIREERNVGEAGVPVYLILEDLTDQASEPIESGDSMFNLLLVISAIHYLDYLVSEDEVIDSDKFSKVLGVLAEKYFDFLSYQSWE
ncbi:MAG: hypothetical protein K9K76_07885 [Halanaerobiales bacterium]|nr:hypothetical protein [Halanaerobiales bacterium]